MGQLQGAVHRMSGGHGPGSRGAQWDRGYGRPRGPREWPGGFGGPWGGWWPGPPGPPRGPKAGRGDVRAAILALLREGPRNGYQIMSEIEERSGGAWRPSPGAVYPALQQLADEGLIEAEESGGRRTFSLTDAGRRYVEENPEMARAAWESMASAKPGRRRACSSRPRGSRAASCRWPTRGRRSRSRPPNSCWNRPAADVPAPGQRRGQRAGRTSRRQTTRWTIASAFQTPTGTVSPPGCVTTSPRAGHIRRARRANLGGAERQDLR